MVFNLNQIKQINAKQLRSRNCDNSNNINSSSSNNNNNDDYYSIFLENIIHCVERYQLEHDSEGNRRRLNNNNNNNINNNKPWVAKLNDQDLFNVYFYYNVKELYILPCEWNIQVHARLNTFIACASDTIKPLIMSRNQQQQQQLQPVGIIKANMVPLNCEASKKKELFVCTNRVKVLHYMAQVYAYFVLQQ